MSASPVKVSQSRGNLQKILVDAKKKFNWFIISSLTGQTFAGLSMVNKCSRIKVYCETLQVMKIRRNRQFMKFI